jgi:hypothetical protein
VTIYFYHDKFTTFPGAILPSLVVLALANAVRGTFMFHKYATVEKGLAEKTT